jgi:hypothetical protein
MVYRSSATSMPFSIGLPHLKHNCGHSHGHKGVSDPRSFQAREDERLAGMGSWLSSSASMGSGKPDSRSMTPNQRDPLVEKGLNVQDH